VSTVIPSVVKKTLKEYWILKKESILFCPAEAEYETLSRKIDKENKRA
jgi:hypothetical protein